MRRLLALVDASLVMRSPQTFDKHYLLPLCPEERHFLIGDSFNKAQAESRILIISTSVCKTKQMLLLA